MWKKADVSFDKNTLFQRQLSFSICLSCRHFTLAFHAIFHGLHDAFQYPFCVKTNIKSYKAKPLVTLKYPICKVLSTHRSGSYCTPVGASGFTLAGILPYMFKPQLGQPIKTCLSFFGVFLATSTCWI